MLSPETEQTTTPLAAAARGQKGGELVSPDVEKAVASMKLFQELKTKLLEKEDVVEISGKTHIKRSGWRKIALAFNISTEIMSVHREKIEGQWAVKVKARAIAPNGRTAEEIATCDGEELVKNRMEPTLHNVETKAATRAINRAISDLVGGGEVTAEELEGPTGPTGPAEPKGPTKDQQQMATPNQVKYIVQLMGKGVDQAQVVAEFLVKHGDKENPEQLSREEASQLIQALTGEKGK